MTNVMRSPWYTKNLSSWGITRLNLVDSKPMCPYFRWKILIIPSFPNNSIGNSKRNSIDELKISHNPFLTLQYIELVMSFQSKQVPNNLSFRTIPNSVKNSFWKVATFMTKRVNISVPSSVEVIDEKTDEKSSK